MIGGARNSAEGHREHPLQPWELHYKTPVKVGICAPRILGARARLPLSGLAQNVTGIRDGRRDSLISSTPTFAPVHPFPHLHDSAEHSVEAAEAETERQ